ncbi:redoxin domain-containing protein [Winogradskyella tangerina]|uniref:redoxin domain-containing protein n=1 Tax=Winogradskyella tangerina TaxID=2023240 RepID=UPI000DBE4160|nr:redoxin domain-containing protein [Winogradskyella tangerina]
MKSIYVLFIAVLFFSCKTESNPIDGYLVEGEAPGVYNGIRTYITLPDARGIQKPIDTAIVMNEKFVFEGNIENPGQYYLKVDNVQQPIPFILSNEKITVKINKEDANASEIISTNNDEYKKFNDGLQSVVAELQELSKERRLAVYNKDTAKAEELLEKLQNEQSRVVDYGFDFINNNPNSVVSLVLLDQQTRVRGIDGEKVQKAYDNLSDELKATTKGKSLNSIVKTLVEQSRKEAALAIGKIAPNFEAPNPDGEMISLDDIKGKVTIIDFWAAWCGPCRQENPNVVRIYEKYHDQGLEIIGVSLDGQARQPNARQAWLSAIEKDGLTWNHVSNLKYFNDPVAKLYNIQAIPATFILDKDGKIVDRNLRGIRLENRIKELIEAQ